jgi:uncharacterized repeat protein (TIGR03847 family)
VPRHVFSFDPPERFVAGTVGEPGQRTFFLQARDASQLASVVLEKEQVALLADRLDALLAEVGLRAGAADATRGDAASNTDDLEPLEQPIVEEFRVGTMTLAWDGADGRIVIEAFAIADADDANGADEDLPSDAVPSGDRDMLVVRMTTASARAFARRARRLVAAGRPLCPLCGLPMDTDGHVCPRQNGHRRRG